MTTNERVTELHAFQARADAAVRATGCSKRVVAVILGLSEGRAYRLLGGWSQPDEGERHLIRDILGVDLWADADEQGA